MAFDEQLTSILKDRGWKSNICRFCQRMYFSKRDFSSCQDFDCIRDLPFLGFTRRKKFVLPNQVLLQAADFFSRQGFHRIDSDSILSRENVTFFVVAGIQKILEDPIFISNTQQQVFIAQPSVRTIVSDQVGKVPGISTSYINLCTAQGNAVLTDFFAQLEHWLDFLSHLGLFMNDVTIVREAKTERNDLAESNPWASIKSLQVWVEYGGVELGEGNYIYHFPQQHDITPLIDFGFGVERICWALNKTSSYEDSVGLPIRGSSWDAVLRDSVRTAVLIAGAGVLPGREGPSYRLRHFIRETASHSKRFEDILPLVIHYHSFWSKSIGLLTEREIEGVLRNEYNRIVASRIYQNLGRKYIDREAVKNFDEMIEELLAEGYTLDELKKAAEGN